MPAKKSTWAVTDTLTDWWGRWLTVGNYKTMASAQRVGERMMDRARDTGSPWHLMRVIGPTQTLPVRRRRRTAGVQFVPRSK